MGKRYKIGGLRRGELPARKRRSCENGRIMVHSSKGVGREEDIMSNRKSRGGKIIRQNGTKELKARI